MERRALAEHLVSADTATRYLILAECVADIDVQLAWEIKTIYDDAKEWDAQKAAACADALRAATNITGSPVLATFTQWIDGMVALHLQSKAETAQELLDNVIHGFNHLQLPILANYTRISLMHALAMLGRYDDSLRCGHEARHALLEINDFISVGKIEQNLGNIYARRGQHAEAEKFFLQAREHYILTGEYQRLAGVESNLASVLTSQYRLKEAEELCKQALNRLKSGKEGEIRASIEGNLGWLALLQGQYHRALDYLERSRRQYANLRPHESAMAELGLANAYLNLNLSYEADAIYTRIERLFSERGLKNELARAWTNHACAYLSFNRFSEAHTLIDQAHNIYLTENNLLGIAETNLVKAQILYGQNSYQLAYDMSIVAEKSLSKTNLFNKILLVCWLRGECASALGNKKVAEDIFNSTLKQAEDQAQPEIIRLCITALGKLALQSGNFDKAKNLFQRAIELIETMRAPLPTEELRSAFLLNKQTPYIEMAHIALDNPKEPNLDLAFQAIEQARSRTLLDMVGGSIQMHIQPNNSEEELMIASVKQISIELGWIYNELSSSFNENQEKLYNDARSRETQMLELMRKLRQSNSKSTAPHHVVTLKNVQKSLSDNIILLEYFIINREIIVLVIDHLETNVYRNIAKESQIEMLVRQFHFQIDTLRYGSFHLQSHVSQLEYRTRVYLQKLYDLLLRPLEKKLIDKRIIIAPYQVLHYVPFHALHDGEQYVIEKYDISYTLSATFLHRSSTSEFHETDRALLIGTSDEYAPHIRDELRSLQNILTNNDYLFGKDANLANLRQKSSQAKIIHIASHGIFRPDNPLFSAIKLDNGWLTVHDIYDLVINGSLVTLSACETGVNSIVSGDELIGLIRGFLTAGAEQLLVSLWVVDDKSTTDLMKSFYTYLINGDNPAKALRKAQVMELKKNTHPFFWSSFILIGGI